MNWPSLIDELQSAGKTQADIAEACGCKQPTISDLARGSIKEPRHSLGQALIAMRASLKKKAAA